MASDIKLNICSVYEVNMCSDMTNRALPVPIVRNTAGSPFLFFLDMEMIQVTHSLATSEQSFARRLKAHL